jgi:hypothetical protein
MRYSIFLSVALCAFSGCGGGSSSQYAKLRVVFPPAAFDGPSTYPSTVTINGFTLVFPQPTCPSANQACTMDYLTVPAGGCKFAAQYPGSSSNVIQSQFQTLSLAPSTQNTFVYLGASQNLLLDDGTPAAGSAKLRIANTDGGLSGPLEAWVNSTGSIAGNPTISAVTLGSASSYVTLPPGSYILTIGLPELGITGVLPVPITLVANQNVTVYLYVNYLLGDSTLILADN